uniref:ribonuclease III n=1 Tax=Amphimedon queenslandica TaxID=400682 RepID=A0A1X7UJF3_AMPQE
MNKEVLSEVSFCPEYQPGLKEEDKLTSIREIFKSKLCTRQTKPTPVDPLIPFNAHHDILDISTGGLSLSHCYLINISPTTNYQTTGLTSVRDESGHHYQFKGFLLLSNVGLDHIPQLVMKQYNIDYTISLKPHPLPTFYKVEDIVLLMQFIFVDLLNLFDWFNKLVSKDFKLFFMPRFECKDRKDNLIPASMCNIMESLISFYKPLSLPRPASVTKEMGVSRQYSNCIIHNSNKSPSSIRVDSINWHSRDSEAILVHLCHFVPDSHITSSPDTVTSTGRHHRPHKHKQQEGTRYACSRKHTRETVVELQSSSSYHFTGIFTDCTQLALLCPQLSSHLLFHLSLVDLEAGINYKFKDRSFLELALTHTSFITQYNGSRPLPNEILISLSNCGTRAHVSAATGKAPPSKRPKSGIEGLTEAAETSREKYKDDEGDVILPRDNERLEFLGDAVIEFLCSIQLYLMFPSFTDSHLVIFRKALICNQNLATVAKRIHLEKYLLMDVNFKNADINHIYANTLEALIGAVYKDSDINTSSIVLATLLFPEEDLRGIWLSEYKDQLQVDSTDGDRHMVNEYPILNSFNKLEESIGVRFTNIRLLARAFTHPSYGCTDLLIGDYQRMEFLGDAILQFLTSDYVYDTFPLHHEGHLSTFRTAIVHNKQLAEVSVELGFPQHLLLGKDQTVTNFKVHADLIESFITALYLDKGMEHVLMFCKVCLFPKLASSAKGLKFLDSKTRLQHAVVYTCKKEKTPIEFPIYRVLSKEGSVSNPIFTVGVYFRGRRIATGTGGSSQNAGMNAAEKGLDSRYIIVPNCLKTTSN